MQPQTISDENIRYIVSLDLGSESMSAFMLDLKGGSVIQVNLQAHANLLAGGAAMALRDTSGISKRMSSRIRVKDTMESGAWPTSHATLELVAKVTGGGWAKANEDACAFTYFLLEDAASLSRSTIPNPKIAYQAGASNVFPHPLSRSTSQPYELDPETVIKHATTQVVQNFVMQSPELRNVTEDQVHLVLTVPNVYSPQHARRLVEFVEANCRFAQVSAVYESDALAYFFFCGGMEKQLRRLPETDNPGQGRRVLTIDVGRGTTDLSLVQVETQQGQEPQFSVVARTGKATGGNYLSYLFVEHYFELLLQAVFQPYLAEWRLDRTPFSFLQMDGEVSSFAQLDVVSLLEQYIEILKRSIDSAYKLRLEPKDTEMAGQLVQQIAGKVRSGAQTNLADLDLRLSTDPRVESAMERIESELVKAFAPPAKLGVMAWELRDPRKKILQGLRDRIARYVTENVDDLLDELGYMAASREQREEYRTKKTGARTLLFDSKWSTFGVIAGQAAQFGPLKARIKEKCAALRHTTYPLEGIDAKTACSHGAARYVQVSPSVRDDGALLGTYGFLAVAFEAYPKADGAFRPVDMHRLRGDGEDAVVFDSPDTRYMVFTPRFLNDGEAIPKPEDGKTSMLTQFKKTREYHVTFDPTQYVLTVNQQVVSPGTYGGIKEQPWPKVWPERLMPGER